MSNLLDFTALQTTLSIQIGEKKIHASLINLIQLKFKVITFDDQSTANFDELALSLERS